MLSKQTSGARAVYAVAAELSRLGLIATVTARNAKGADILVTDESCKRAFSVQVKSARTKWSWLVSEILSEARSHVFVFVYFPEEGQPEFHVVPSKAAARLLKDPDRKMPYVRRSDMEKFQNKWGKSVFDRSTRLVHGRRPVVQLRQSDLSSGSARHLLLRDRRASWTLRTVREETPYPGAIGLG